MNPAVPHHVPTVHDGDSGLTLIELIVSILVSTIILLGVATIIGNSWAAQNDVLSTSQATNRGQLMSTTVERALRNALYFEVKSSGSELWVRTTFTDGRRCQAFHITNGIAELKTDGASVASKEWGRWIDVAEYKGFKVNVVAPGSGAFAQTPTTGIGKVLDYDFAIDTDAAPVHFSGEISIRAGEVGNGGCW